MIILSNDSLYNHYTMNFALRQQHNFNLTELDDMLPFERDVYVSLLVQKLEEDKQRQKSQTDISWT